MFVAAIAALLLSGVASAHSQHHLPAQVPLVPGLLPDADAPPESDVLEFRLAHIFHHGTVDYPGLHRRMDVRPSASVWIKGDENDSEQYRTSQLMPPLRARPRGISVQRLTDRSPQRIDDLLAAARWFGHAVDVPASDWTIDSVSAPNVTDRDTVLTLARAASNAYVEKSHTGNWEDVKGGFNYTQDFGWEQDGIRGHIFADTKNSTVIIGIKGTTMAIFDGADTTSNDKMNDNLFFGCCCGQGSWWTRNYCDCQTKTFTCNTTCVQTALRDKNRYYYAAMDLFNNVTELYPESDIWFAGHSLGGSVSSLVGMTVGKPVVTFEAPGEAMAAQRLGLPTPPGFRIGGNGETPPPPATYHFGHNGDPLYTGQCGQKCYIGGYAMESQCHSGHECVYNTTGDLGWGASIANHGIQTVLHQVLEAYNETAPCEVISDCNDCPLWNYFESNSSSSTTTTKPTSTEFTRTRTATCMTPGWWGCLDETTTASSTSTSTSTSTCKTPGWFGCKDPITTTSDVSTGFADTTSADAVSATVTEAPLDASPSRRHLSPAPTLPAATARQSNGR